MLIFLLCLLFTPISFAEDDVAKQERVENVKKMLDSPLRDIQWADSETIFVITDKGNLYLSNDRGRSWQNQMRKLAVPGSSTPSSTVIEAMHFSPVDKSKIFFDGKDHDNWYTTDMGKTYHHSAQLLSEIKLHPVKAEWLLASGNSAGCVRTGEKPHTKSDKSRCFKALYLSKDMGGTWKHLKDYVVQFDWSPTIGQVDHKGKTVGPDRIYAAIHNQPAGDQKYGTWDKNIDFVTTDDYFKTTQVVVKHGNRFLFGDYNYLFVAQVNPLSEQEVALQISRDNVSHLHFETARLPVSLKQHSYTILDTSEGVVFLHVNHEPFSENSYAGHVYVSDWSGLLYTLALPYNRRSSDGKCDFDKIEGLEGVYIANFIDEEEIDKLEAAMAARGQISDKANRRLRLRTSTVITFDKGGKWSYLTAPLTNSNGRTYNCSVCHLHLHGYTGRYGPVYSAKTATGIIIGTGVVGEYLESSHEISTFLSRDAGLTWKEVATGSHIYEIGNHGGLIVMAPDSQLTTYVLYTWNEGVTWNRLKISEDPLQVENIIIEPEAQSQQFVVYGWQGDVGVLVYIDFADLHTRACVGVTSPDTTESDYEVWSPSDGRMGGKCLMGHKVSYTRRKAERECFNSEEYERGEFFENCVCQEFDFECDYGYERQKNRAGEPYGECEKLNLPPSHADFSPYVFGSKCVHRETRGYRRVPGDTCIGGAKWEAIEIPCDDVKPSRLAHLILIFLFFIVLSLVFVTISSKNQALGGWFTQIKDYLPLDKQGEPDRPDNDDEDNFLDEVDHPAKEIGAEDDLQKAAPKNGKSKNKNNQSKGGFAPLSSIPLRQPVPTLAPPPSS